MRKKHQNSGGGDSKQPDDPMLVATAEYLEQLRLNNDAARQLTETWELFHECHELLIEQLIRRQHLPAEVIDDLRQDVWIEIAKWLPKLRNKTTAGFMVWLSRVVDHKVAAYLRKPSRATVSFDALSDGSFVSQPSGSADDAELIEQLRSSTTTTNYKILHMRLVGEASVEEVAAEFNISAQRVRYRTHRARRQLRDILRRLLDEE